MTAASSGIALAAVVGLFAHIVGYDRDRSFYAVVLTVVGALYVLFTVIAGAGRGLVPEALFFALFAALAVIGFRTSLWVVVGGLALHSAYDFFRHLFPTGGGVPAWWPAFCGAYDATAALGLATLLIVERKRRESESHAKSAI